MAFSANEQLMIELVNRARLDPQTEADRLGIGLNDGLAAGTISGDVLTPLAGNLVLRTAAQDHADWMLEANVFSHTGSGGSTATQRIDAAGYVLTPPWGTGENIAWSGTTGRVDALAAVGAHHDGLFRSAGHRTNILQEGFNEVGIAQSLGVFTYQGTGYNASMLVQNFGASGTDLSLTGVAIDDADGDLFYDPGEAIVGAGFAIGALAAATEAAGGYNLVGPFSGLQEVSVTLDRITTVLEVDFTAGNVKLDILRGLVTELATSANATLGDGQAVGAIQNLRALGAGDIELTGNAESNLLSGNGGNNILSGRAGDDSLNGGDGSDSVEGGDGNDTLNGGDTSDDLGDTLNGGEGDDSIDGGYGNDRVSGGNGNDTVEGGFGVDTIIGNAGDDVLTGSAYSDLIFGGDGFDFINGGFGSDRVNGGDGGDRFFHIGLAGHGSDWIQDYDAAEGDVLRYGGASRDVADFQVNFANTAGAGSASVDEAFVIYRPTGQILWALIDGGAQTEINIQLGGDVYDLLA